MRKPLVILGMFLTLGASARDFAEPCRADLDRLCSDVKPGGGRLIACLKAHEDKLSEECSKLAAEVKGKVRGKFLSCLRENFIRLGADEAPAHNQGQ